MSQEKVNRYKEQKANRKQLMQKEKRQSGVRRALAVVLGAVCVVWIGYSVYGVATRPDTSSTEVKLDAYTEYVSELSAQE